MSEKTCPNDDVCGGFHGDDCARVANSLDELTVDDFEDVAEDHTVDIRGGSVQDAGAAVSANAAVLEASSPGVRLARGTEPVDLTGAQLHAALTVVADLLGVIDCKAHMFQPAQDAIWRAKQLLKEHGKAGKR